MECLLLKITDLEDSHRNKVSGNLGNDYNYERTPGDASLLPIRLFRLNIVKRL